jgi:hypothetical protein
MIAGSMTDAWARPAPWLDHVLRRYPRAFTVALALLAAALALGLMFEVTPPSVLYQGF